MESPNDSATLRGIEIISVSFSFSLLFSLFSLSLTLSIPLIPLSFSHPFPSLPLADPNTTTETGNILSREAGGLELLT